MERQAFFIWVLTGGFVFGILARTYVSINLASGLFLLLLALAILVASGTQWRRSLLLVSAIGMSVLGVWRAEMGGIRGDPMLDRSLDSRVQLEGVITREPDVREGSVRITFRPTYSGGPTAVVDVLAILPPHTVADYGDHVRISGVLALPRAFDVGGSREFDYPGYLATRGVGYLLERAHLDERSNGVGQWYSFQAWAIATKKSFSQGLAAALPEPHAGLAAGITVGDTRGLGESVEADFRAVSLTHILVLSGYNISIVAAALAGMLGHARWFVRVGVGAWVALFFVAMTGGAAASVRAATMALIAMWAREQSRVFDAGRALALVICGMAAWNPLAVAFDPGFALSILATLGIIYIAPVVRLWVTWVPERFGVRELVTSSLSAQIAVIPYLLFQSGQFSLYALPANLVALGAVPLAMAFSFVSGIAGLALGPLAPIAGLPAYALLAYILGVAGLFAHMPFATLWVPVFGIWALATMYGLLALSVWWLFPKKETAAGEVAVSRTEGLGARSSDEGR